MTTEILSVHENNSADFLHIYETHVDCFRTPVSHPLCSSTSSPSNNPHSKALHMKLKQTLVLRTGAAGKLLAECWDSCLCAPKPSPAALTWTGLVEYSVGWGWMR